MLNRILHKITNYIHESTRLRILFNYLFPLIGLFIVWGLISQFYLLKITANDCVVTTGVLTKYENVIYKTSGRRHRENLHEEKHLEINYTHLFVLDKNTFGDYENMQNEYGLFVPSLKLGDTISVYSYVGPSYIFGARGGKVFKIEKGNIIVFPESVFFEEIKFGMRFFMILFGVIALLYYLFVVRPKIQRRKTREKILNLEMGTPKNSSKN